MGREPKETPGSPGQPPAAAGSGSSALKGGAVVPPVVRESRACGWKRPVRRLFYCDHHSFPLPPGHKFPAGKYAQVRALVEAAGVWRLEPAPAAALETIALAHEAAYVRAFVEGVLGAGTMRRIGFPWSQPLVSRTLASVGGTLAAARDALSGGLGGNLAGGTHHAFRAVGAGFCVFNDLAVAALWLRSEGLAERVAIVDLDVHQGDGTAAIFEGDDAVLTVSLHGRNNFPFHKRQSSIDVDLPDGTGDEEYLRALAAVLPRVAEFAPGAVLYQSGVDALTGDRFGRLALTSAGLCERDRMLFQMCLRTRLPVVVTLGGGYADPVSRTAEAHANTFRIAAEVFGA